MLPDQDLLEDSVQQEAVLAYLPGEELRDCVRRRWASGGVRSGEDVSTSRWHMLLDEVEAEKQGLARAGKAANRAVEAVRQAKALDKVCCQTAATAS